LSDSLVPDFAVKKELEELREKAGERIEYFLNRLEGGEERSKLSEAGLWIDSYSLRDLSHRIPSPYGEVSGKFEESVRLVFGGWETGAAGGKEKDKKTKLQAIRSGLSSLFDSWERLPLGGGGEAAFKLIYEYDLGSIFEIVTTTLEPSTLATSKPSKWRQEVGYNDLFKREYGSLLGRLKPSPSEWLEQGEDEPGVVERGSHLIEYLSRSGSAGEARKIWEKIEQFRNRHEVVEQETRELESKLGLGDEARLTGLTALVDGLLMERFYEDANRLTAELEELAKQVGKEESKLEIEAYRILVKLASNQGRQNILVKLHKHLEAIKLRSTSLTPPSPIETFVRRLRTKSARSDVQAVQSLFTEFRSCSDWAQASREDQSRIWSQVILAQTRTNDVESAIQSLQSLVESGLRPPLASINTILFGFARRGDVETVDKLFQQLIRGDFDRLKPDVGSWNALILARIVVKDPSAASSIIYEMRRSSIEPNRQTWTTLMSGLVDTSQWRQAFEIYRYLEQHPSPSMRPDTATINVILKACVLTATPASSVLSLFRQLLIRGFRPNMMTYTLVLQSLTTAGLMDLAEELYLMMDRPSSNSTPSSLTPALPISMTPVRPDQFIYSTLIAGYLKQDEQDKARACMQEMRRRGIEPSSITLAIVVGSRLNERSTPMKVKQLVAEARRLMVEEGSGLTRMRKSQSWRRDKKLAMGDEAIAVFAPIFRSAAKQGLAEAALELLEEVQSRRRTENEVPVELYTMLMDSFRRVDDQEAAADNVKTVWDRVYEAVAERFMAVQTSSDKSTPHLPSSRFTAHQLTTSRLDLRIDPAQASILCVPLTIYLESLAQVGRHHLFGITWRALARQGFSFDASNWNVLALYFARDLQLERAFWISEYILCRPLDDKSPIPSPAKFEADLASVTRSSAIARTPSRLFQLRQHERDRHSKKPLDLNSLLPSSASTSSPSTELDIYTKFDEALTRRNAMFWHPFGSLLEALEKALETLTVSGEVKVETGGGEGTGLREVAALEQIKEKLVLEHPRTMEAIELWRTRGERKEREKERYLSVRGSRRW
jgi:pentatricopeptide repeat protein